MKIRQAAEAATDFSWLSPGDTVFIKPASNSGTCYPATTLPLAVTAMAGLLFDRGAGTVYVGDQAGIEWVHITPHRHRGCTRLIMMDNHLQQAIEATGATPYYYEEDGYDSYFETAPAGESHWSGPIWMPNILREVDHVILLPRISSHATCGISFGIKNNVGWIREDSRLEMHREADTFFEKVAEISQVPELNERLRLVLTVSTLAQTTLGPDFGFKVLPDPGLVIASPCPAAHDVVAMAWHGYLRDTFTPPKVRKIDYYPGLSNIIHWFSVGIVWGLREFLHYKPYNPPPLGSPWENPLVSWAAHLYGLNPATLQIEDVDGTVPTLYNALLTRIAFPLSHVQNGRLKGQMGLIHH